jgi:hypothetical protein
LFGGHCRLIDDDDGEIDVGLVVVSSALTCLQYVYGEGGIGVTIAGVDLPGQK